MTNYTIIQGYEFDNYQLWYHPDNYDGPSPEGDIVVYSRHRDSSILDDSNYECILEDLLGLQEALNISDLPESMECYDFRARHWAVGWVEYIIVPKTAPEPMIKLAWEIIAALAEYPVYSDDDYSQRQFDAAEEYLNELNLAERVELAKECDVSIFAARSLEKLVTLDGVYEHVREKEIFY